jgi:hypothetical protein
MANKARWVHAIHHTGGFIMVTVGTNSSTVTGTVELHTLPRQDLRRASAHLGLDGGMNRTNEELLRAITEFANDRDNHDDDGRIIPRRSGYRATPTPKIITTDPTPKIDHVPSGSVDRVLDDVIRSTVRQELESAKVGVDESTIETIIRRVVGQPKQIIVNDVPKGNVTGRTHNRFDALVRKVASRRNIAITGGPGTGKTYIVTQVAEALGLPSVGVSADPLPQRFEIIGGIAPALGKLVKGAFREIYEHGGVGFIDEWDRGHVSLGTAFNRLLANDTFDFDTEDGGKQTVKRHKDFMVIATLNTYGQGASIEFAGANKIDDAGLDRFTFFHLDTDEDLTEQICYDTDSATASQIIPIWKQARRNVEKYRLKVWVTPRCAFDAQEFLRQGDTVREAFDGRLFGRGLPTDQEAKLLEGITF